MHSRAEIIQEIRENPPVTDLAALWLAAFVAFHWWKFILSPGQELVPVSLPVKEVIFKSTDWVGHILQITWMKCEKDPDGKYSLFINGWVNHLVNNKPSAPIKTEQKVEWAFPDFLVEKMSSDWYDFGWVPWICSYYGEMFSNRLHQSIINSTQNTSK